MGGEGRVDGGIGGVGRVYGECGGEFCGKVEGWGI